MTKWKDFNEYFIQPYSPILPAEQIDFLHQHLHEKYINEKKGFVYKGTIDNRTYFLVNGLVKEFEERSQGQKTAITNFITPGYLISFLPSNLSDGVAWCDLETITKIKLYYLEKEALLYMFSNFEELSHIYLSHTTNLIKLYDHRLRYLFCDNSKERYKKFIEDFSEYHLLIPQNEIASYLNLTPETVSRIRNENY